MKHGVLALWRGGEKGFDQRKDGLITALWVLKASLLGRCVRGETGDVCSLGIHGEMTFILPS